MKTTSIPFSVRGSDVVSFLSENYKVLVSLKREPWFLFFFFFFFFFFSNANRSSCLFSFSFLLREVDRVKILSIDTVGLPEGESYISLVI